MIKSITVTLQCLDVPDKLATGLFGYSEAVGGRFLPIVSASPIITIDPRKRKFHEPVEITMPLPNFNDSQSTDGISAFPKDEYDDSSKLRLLYSVQEGTESTEWHDITGETPLSMNSTKTQASVTTTVSARYWLLHVKDPSRSEAIAMELYRLMCRVPYKLKFQLYSKYFQVINFNRFNLLNIFFEFFMLKKLQIQLQSVDCYQHALSPALTMRDLS